VLLAILHVPILRLLFQRGEFDQSSLLLTGRALLYYTPGVIGLAGAEIVIRTFYAMEDTRTPVIIGILTIVINAVLTWVVITFFQADIAVVALSYSVTNVFEFVLLLALLARRLPGLVNPRLIRSSLALILSSIALAVVVIAAVGSLRLTVPGLTFDSSYGRGADFFWLAGALTMISGAGFAAYLVVAAVFKAPELTELWSLLRRRSQS
jgi:putative peptidoglycan lipid II flippase